MRLSKPTRLIAAINRCAVSVLARLSGWYRRWQLCRPLTRWLLSGIPVIVVLLAAYAVTRLLEVPGVDQQLTMAAQQALRDQKLMRVEVRFDDREALLQGRVASPIARQAAIDVVAQLPAVRRVRDGLEIWPIRAAYVSIFYDREQRLQVEGELPTREIAADWMGRIQAAFDYHQVADLIRIDLEVSEPDWEALLYAVLAGRLEARLTPARITVGLRQLSVAGLVNSEADYADLIDWLHRTAADAGWRFRNQIGIRPGPAEAGSPPGAARQDEIIF